MRKFILLSILIISLVCIGLGFYNGELDQIWQKGSTICMECIGLG